MRTRSMRITHTHARARARRWDTHLEFLVGSDVKVTKNAKRVFEKAGLMQFDHDRLAITSQGFQFLLQDRTTQV